MMVPPPSTAPPGAVLSAILRHDAKTASYKIALLRALADVALSCPSLGEAGLPVAVPLTAIADFWLAYYWPFADPARPIAQGQRSRRASGLSADVVFRPQLDHLVALWQQTTSASFVPSDGYVVMAELRTPRKRTTYPPALVSAFDQARAAAAGAVLMPVRYAGGTNWSVFARPAPLADTPGPLDAHPAARPSDPCVVVAPPLWQDFRRLSLWIEALSIHEWCLYSASLRQPAFDPVTRGQVYQLLTDRPDNRRPLTWERNQIDILIMEGHIFECPWSHKRLSRPGAYDLDHIVPVSVYPMNEVWNLVPSDPRFNQHTKRHRLPSASRLAAALPALSATYATYLTAPDLATALREDVSLRFGSAPPRPAALPPFLAEQATAFVERIAQGRNLPRF